MIMFWNRREVYVGNSLQKFSEVREKLVANDIEYHYRLVNHHNTHLFSSRRARTFTFGENRDYSTTYYVYVHKHDYVRACAVLHGS